MPQPLTWSYKRKPEVPENRQLHASTIKLSPSGNHRVRTNRGHSTTTVVTNNGWPRHLEPGSIPQQESKQETTTRAGDSRRANERLSSFSPPSTRPATASSSPLFHEAVTEHNSTNQKISKTEIKIKP
uniref:(northern house mosquito) hypothetical protein n=1 Tax=Culex pipiens TaxID=7175 RepID=A0A8D8FUX2_CULPI